MAIEASTVIGGVDTHKHTHYAAVIDDQGRLVAHQQFPATDHGYQTLLEWMREHGRPAAIGVESTGSFGAALARALTAAGERVVEVNRPNRFARHMDGKSDRLDAEQIARAVLGRTSTATPKAKSGTVEVIRTLRVTRSSAVKARTQAFNTLFGVMIRAPSPLRDELVDLTKRTLVNRCLRLRPETEDLHALATEPQRLLLAGTKTALRDLARRWKALEEEIKALDRQIDVLVRAAAPDLVAPHGVGVELAGQFLVTAGDNPERIRNEAAFASSAGSHPNRPAAAAPPAVTGSAEAETVPPTAPSTSSPSCACATTPRPGTTCNDAPQRACPSARSSAASSATSPARSTPTSPAPAQQHPKPSPLPRPPTPPCPRPYPPTPATPRPTNASATTASTTPGSSPCAWPDTSTTSASDEPTPEPT